MRVLVIADDPDVRAARARDVERAGFDGLWATPILDRHMRGAIRSHVHTLRGKLSTAGFAGSVESKTGEGYRLMLEPRD
jgi:DNA-binding response OmpR family regulator